MISTHSHKFLDLNLNQDHCTQFLHRRMLTKSPHRYKKIQKYPLLLFNQVPLTPHQNKVTSDSKNKIKNKKPFPSTYSIEAIHINKDQTYTNCVKSRLLLYYIKNKMTRYDRILMNLQKTETKTRNKTKQMKELIRTQERVHLTLRIVFEMLQQNKLMVNKNKCDFGVPRAEYSQPTTRLQLKFAYGKRVSVTVTWKSIGLNGHLNCQALTMKYNKTRKVKQNIKIPSLG